MAPDIEILVSFLVSGNSQGRLVLHSLLGVAILSTVLSVFVTVFLYPSIVSLVFRLDKKRIEERCRFSSVLVLSCVFGGLAHVFADSTSHKFNPLFYPFVSESFDAFRLTTNCALNNLIVSSALLLLLILFFVNEIRKGTKNFWMRMLVDRLAR